MVEEEGRQLPVDASKHNIWAQRNPLEQHQRYQYPVDSSTQSNSSGDLLPLPMHTEHPGRLPVYFDLSDVAQAPENQLQTNETFTRKIVQPSMFVPAPSFSEPGIAALSTSGKSSSKYAVRTVV